MRSTNNETRVERNRLHAVNTYGVVVKFWERILRGKWAFFLCGKIKMVFTCVPSLVNMSSLTHKINFHRNLNFGYRQDTMQVDHAGRRLLSGVNFLFYNTDTWVKRAFFLLFLKILPLVFPVKVSAFVASRCCSKNRNAGSWQNVWAKYATQNAW